ncbi:Fur family transcriptional regulator [Planococcus sp. APC 4015]|nr:Fur family transcriptional regulator [Planococcus sp. APC 4015]
MSSTAIPLHETDAGALIRRAGLRVTEPRRAVVDALRQRPHASADAVFRLVTASVPQTSLQSVYNALGDFADAGLVRRIEPAGRPGLFELRVDDNHHHIICSGCGAVEDVDCAHGEAPCLTPTQTHGFAVHTAEVTYWGTCPACAAATRDS